MQKKTKGFSYQVRVKLKGFGKYKAYSDLIETYCCSATPCYLVVFPGIGYEWYYEKWEVEVKKKDKR
ncbi:hypothetical protein ES703_99790 [subsurface metagenome]